jgi:multisubunit Na+/H+ antiporter MnhB subunit
MVLNIVLILVGLLFLVLMMALVLNPPEAWIKRVFLSKHPSKPKSKRF